MCLEPLGVPVCLAGSRDEALQVAESQEIGLILLDLALGEEDGLEILPALRAHESLTGVPVVAFSAHDSRRREAMGHGVDSFLGRPFVSTDLYSAVELLFVP